MTEHQSTLMTDVTKATPRMSETLRVALKDCASFPIYWWKPKAMAKLASLGLVERVPNADRAGLLAWQVTAAGREALR